MGMQEKNLFSYITQVIISDLNDSLDPQQIPYAAKYISSIEEECQDS